MIGMSTHCFYLQYLGFNVYPVSPDIHATLSIQNLSAQSSLRLITNNHQLSVGVSQVVNCVMDNSPSTHHSATGHYHLYSLIIFYLLTLFNRIAYYQPWKIKGVVGFHLIFKPLTE